MTPNKIALTGLLLIIASILIGQNTLSLDSTTLTKKELVTGIQIPWELTWGPDDHLWFTQRNGMIYRTNPNSGNTKEILDFRSIVTNEDDEGDGSEYGMLGMCFHPDFENHPLLYVVYNYGNIKERLVSFEWNGDQLINEKILLDELPGGVYHNGSRLLMTMDEKILMSTGDLTIPQNGQNMGSLNGKFLRINLDGSIPEDNPFPNSYIYTFGHRNSQGISYGPGGKLYITEHGTNVSDEISILESGGNYGWANVLGYCDTNVEIDFCNANNVIEPIYDWSPCIGVSDLVYYDHNAIPEWKGKLLVSILGGVGFITEPRISVMSLNEEGTEITAEELFFENFGRIRDVCINPHTGSVYFATNGQTYPGYGPNQIIEYTNLDFTTSTDDKSLLTELNINPNPAENIIVLECNEELLGSSLEVISYKGDVVFLGKIYSSKQELNIHQLPIGNYFVRCSNSKGQITRTFSKVK